MVVRDAARSENIYSRVLAPRPPEPNSAPGMFPDHPAGGTASTGEAQAERPVKRRRVACQQCRQAKLRCEGADRGAQPCQRCQELSKPCVIDTEYKRISKRTTLNDLADQVELLRAAGSLSQVEHGTGSNPNQANKTVSPHSEDFTTKTPAASSTPASGGSHPTPAPAQILEMPFPFPVPQRGGAASDDRRIEGPADHLSQTYPAVTERTTGSITIGPDEVSHFFKVYFTHYHPSFPVVKPPPSADVIYEASELLFWTIVMTAARHDQFNLSLLETLMPAVQRLLWSMIATPPHTLATLQAMSILCMWPFPTSSMPLDITYILAGNLKSAAMHAGLHRADSLTHFSRVRYSLSQAQLNELVRVWCCVYIAVESVAAMIGQEPYFTTDRTVERASAATNPYNLPTVLHHAVMAQRFCNRVHTAMADVDRLEGFASQPSRVSMLKVLESDLLELERQLGKVMSHRSSVSLLSSCVQLRAYWLLDDEESSSRKEGVIKAFNSSVQLVSELAAGDVSESPFKYLTMASYELCFTVGVLLSKVMSSNYRHFVDTDRGKHAFNTCILLFKQCSIEDNDLPGRTTKILAQLWALHRAQTDASILSPRLSVKSRLLLSIVHDSLWLWREHVKYAEHPSRPTLPPPFLSSAAMENSSSPYINQAPSPALSTARREPVGDGAFSQSLSDFTNPIVSSIETQSQSAAPTPAPGPTLEPMVTVAEEDGLTWDVGFLDSSSMYFDMPFVPSSISFEVPPWLQQTDAQSITNI